MDAKGSLACKSGSGQSQPLISGVASFKLRFRVNRDGQVRSMLASEVEAAQQWQAVHAVEVCLELRGEQRVTAAERQYAGCSQRSASDTGRATLVTRKLFLLNSSAEG